MIKGKLISLLDSFALNDERLTNSFSDFLQTYFLYKTR